MISIIIPAYNEEKFIERCVRSLSSAKKHCEVIVVDNNSTDRTAQIAKKYAKVIRCKKQGISAARNYGARHSKGEIICFVDSDAEVSRGWDIEVKRCMEKGYDCVSGLNLFSSSNPIKYIYYNIYNAIVFTILFFSNKADNYFVAGNNMAIKREVFDSAGGFPGCVAEDIWFSKKLREQKLKAGFCPKMKIYYEHRRFEKKGFFATLGEWINASVKEKPEAGYKENFV